MPIISGGVAALSGTSKIYDFTISGADQASIDTAVDGTTVANFGTASLLTLVSIQRTDDAGALANAFVNVNNDSAAVYDRQVLQGANATASAALATPATNWTVTVHGTGGLALSSSAVVIQIPYYAATNFHKIGTMFNPVRDTTAGNNLSALVTVTYEATAAIIRAKVAAVGTAKLKVGSSLAVYIQ